MALPAGVQPMPSMVTMGLSPTLLTGSTQDRTGIARELHGACPALGDAAAELGSHQPDDVPQHPQQRHVGGCVDGMLLTVYRQLIHLSAHAMRPS